MTTKSLGLGRRMQNWGFQAPVPLRRSMEVEKIPTVGATLVTRSAPTTVVPYKPSRGAAARCRGRACPSLSRLPTIRRPVTCGCAACYAERLGLSGAKAAWTTSSGRLEGSAFQPAGRKIRRCRIARRGGAFPHSGAAEPLSRQASAANLDSRGACHTRGPTACKKGDGEPSPTSPAVTDGFGGMPRLDPASHSVIFRCPL